MQRSMQSGSSSRPTSSTSTRMWRTSMSMPRGDMCVLKAAMKRRRPALLSPLSAFSSRTFVSCKQVQVSHKREAATFGRTNVVATCRNGM